MPTTRSSTRVSGARITQRGSPPAPTPSAQPVVAKQRSLFLLSTDDGDLLANSDPGLYFHDMRYLGAET